MDCKLYRSDEQQKSQWTGGTTTQLAIYPEHGSYIERHFLWRLSSATVELEESDFSKLPDYDRILMVLDGSVVLSHNDEKVVKLEKFQQASFDGAWKTKSYGKIIDYNLMVKKGGRGSLRVLPLTEEKQWVSAPISEEFGMVSQGFYCHEGYGMVVVEGQEKVSHMLKKGDQLIVNLKGDDIGRMKIGVMGEGKLIHAQVEFNHVETGPQIIPKEKPCAEDFITAAVISMTNFRGSKYLFKWLKNVWYDEALKKGISKIEKPLLPFILWLVGLSLATYGGNVYYGPVGALAGAAIWTVLQYVAITPFIYFLVLPKPIRKHIKPLNNLTEYEKNVYEAERKNNDRAERILKKYKITGRNVYAEDPPEKK